MKKLLLIVLGCVPFAVGWAMNGLLAAVDFFWLVSLLFLLFWGWLGYLTHSWGRGRTVTALIHVPAVLAMAANLVQTLVFHRFYSDWTIHFFMPTLTFSAKLTRLLPYTPRVLREDSVVGVLLMIAVFWIGRRIARKR